MKILYIIPYVPYPLNSGGNQAFFNMVDAVRKEHQVSLLLYIHTSRQLKDVKSLQDVWPDVTYYCFSKEAGPANIRPKAKSRFDDMPMGYRLQCRFFEYVQKSMSRKIARRERKYISGNEPLEEFNLGNFVRRNSVLFANNADMNDDFLEYVKTISSKGFDLIQVEFYEYLPLAYILPADVKSVFVHHELRYIRNANEMQLFDEVKPTDTILYERQKAEEFSLLNKYSRVIVLTETDKQLLAKGMPIENIYVSPALTSAGKAKQHKPFKPAKDIVFVGGGDHFPNADGVLWFCKEVIPELKKTGPLPAIYIVGKWNDSIRETIHRFCPDVTFTGFVDDLAGFINGKISIVPIRIGSGMRMKILDAISASAPLVTTTKGCEGLPLVNGADCEIADTATAFAQSIREIQNNISLQEQMTKSAVSKLDSRFDGVSLIKKRLLFYSKNK